jgi:hypothetical protein
VQTSPCYGKIPAYQVECSILQNKDENHYSKKEKKKERKKEGKKESQKKKN